MPRESGKNSYLNLNKARQYLASDQTGCYPYLEIGLEVVRKQDRQGEFLQRRYGKLHDQLKSLYRDKHLLETPHGRSW